MYLINVVYDIGEPTKIVQINLVEVTIYINDEKKSLKFYLDQED